MEPNPENVAEFQILRSRVKSIRESCKIDYPSSMTERVRVSTLLADLHEQLRTFPNEWAEQYEEPKV